MRLCRLNKKARKFYKSPLLFFSAGFFLFFSLYTYAQTYHEIIEGVKLNNQDIEYATLFLQDNLGNLYVSESDLKIWSILIPKVDPITHFGTKYYPFSSFKGGTFSINKQQSTININIPASSMQSNFIDATPKQFKIPTKSNFGAYLSYDLLGQKNFDASSQDNMAGIFTPGIFTKYGNLTDNFVLQTNNNNKIINDVNTSYLGLKTTYTRLNTTWESNFPEKMQTLRIGDTYNVPGMWGRSVDFGGIQWGTDFSTQPNYLTFPMIGSAGEATVPTAVDLYVNNSLASQSKINSGPFSITNIPTINGAGMVNVVTTDVLGRQQVISIPYYTSTSLLKKGLHSYSVESGFIRQNYGTDSNNYANFMTVGTYSRGITNNLTSEVHAEILANHQTLGFGETYLLSKLGVINIATAGSTNKDGIGGVVLIGFQRQSHINNISFGFNAQATTHDFKQVGFDDEDQLPPSLQNQIFFSMPIGKASIGLSYTQQNNRNGYNINLLNLNYNQAFFRFFSVNFSAFTNVYGSENKAIMLTIIRAFSNRTYANIGGNVQKNNTNGTIQLTRSLPTDAGYGYNLVATSGENPNYLASFSKQTSFGAYTISTAYQNSSAGIQAQANGGVVALDKSIFFTRNIFRNESFAVVDVPGMPNVTIYSNNAPYTSTNIHGKAVVTNLLPYQDNKIAFEPNDLPLNTTIGANELNIIPYNNSGLVVKFPVKLNQSATMTLINATNNQPLPMGTSVTLLGSKNKEQFIVANDGALYIADLAETNILRAVWDNEKCTAKVHYKTSNDPLPNLGTIICR